MRFLVVDESSEFRRMLATMLLARWPSAQIDEWDPRKAGNPAPALVKMNCDAVLLEARPAGGDGLAWLAEIRSSAAAPPVVLIADHGDTHVAIQAMKAGAADFLRRAGLTSHRLARALEDALRQRAAALARIAAVVRPCYRMKITLCWARSRSTSLGSETRYRPLRGPCR
jgi:DNA-binding NtrC family response regulator